MYFYIMPLLDKFRNRYVYRSRISESKFRELVKYFSHDIDATRTALFTGLSRATANRYFMEIRRRLHEHVSREKIMKGPVELDESYFGARRIRGKRGRGAGGKTIVFGIRTRKGGVYTEIVPDAKKGTLLPIVESLVSKRVSIHTDGWRSYNGLSGMGYRHYQVNHGEDEFADGKCHVNGIESFWAYAKRRLVKFCGVKEKFFSLHLSECEFRFNHRGWKGVYKELLKMFRKLPLFGTLSKVVSVCPGDAVREDCPNMRHVYKPDAPRNVLSDFLPDRHLPFIDKSMTNVLQSRFNIFRLFALYMFFCSFLL